MAGVECLCIGHVCARRWRGKVERLPPCEVPGGCARIALESPFGVCGFLPEAYSGEDHVYILYGFRGSVHYTSLYLLGEGSRLPTAVFPRCDLMLYGNTILVLDYFARSKSIIEGLSLEARVKGDPGRAADEVAQLYRGITGVTLINLSELEPSGGMLYEDRRIKIAREELISPPTYRLFLYT